MAEITTGIWRINIYKAVEDKGVTLDGVKYFDNRQEASDFVEKYNKDNPTNRTAEWGKWAEYVGRI